MWFKANDWTGYDAWFKANGDCKPNDELAAAKAGCPFKADEYAKR